MQACPSNPQQNYVFEQRIAIEIDISVAIK